MSRLPRPVLPDPLLNLGIARHTRTHEATGDVRSTSLGTGRTFRFVTIRLLMLARRPALNKEGGDQNWLSDSEPLVVLRARQVLMSMVSLMNRAEASQSET